MMQWEKPILPRRITEIAQRLRSSSTDLVLSLSSGTDKRHQQHVGLKYGYLHKSSFRIKRWTQAWFVLEARELTYYSDEQVNEPKVISLKSQCSVIEADINETKRSFSFKIAIQRRTFVLAAESRASMEEWINALRAISGLYQSPPPSLSSAPPLEQAIQLLQALENMLSVCSKVVSQASNCQVPGVCDQNKLATITAAALKCASSGRVVAFRPTAVTASQQLASSLSEISEHARKYNDVLKLVSTTGRKVEVDILLDSTESLYSLTASLFDKCVPEPEPPTEQETILVTCRNATTSASSVFAAAREKDINRLVEVSKLLVNAVTSLYEATRAIEKGNSKHAQPKALAHRCLALARDLIAKAKAFHISTRKDDETEASLAAVKLQEQIAAVVGAAQAAGQHLIIDQQLSEAVAIIQNSANDMREATDITPTITNGEDGIPNSQVITKEATYSMRVVECANCLSDAISSLPNAIKQCSKTTLFNVAKVIGTSTNSLVKSAAEFSALYPSHDPNFIARLAQSIRAMQSSGWQLLSMAKVVIQEEFKNQSDLLQTSGMAQSHAVCVAYILSELKSQITLKNSKSDGDDEKGSTTSFTTTSSSDSDLSLSGEFSIVPLSSRESSFFGSHRDISSLGRSSPLFFKKDNLRPTTSKRILQMVLDEDQSIENEDVDIWNEPPDSDENIIVGVNEDGETYTKAATLNKLIIKLTNENDHDIKFQKTFIITYRSFTTPTRLLKKLMQRYNVIIPKLPPAISPTEYRKKSVLPIQLRVINVLKMWIETAFYDMNDDLIRKLRHFTENVLVMDGHNALANQIGAIIDKQLKVRHADEFPQFPPYVPLPDQTASLETHSEEEIAQQLTKVDFELYTTIKPVELLNQAWNKESLKHRAPNVLAMISRFNAISTWAASVILWKQTIKERVTLWVKLVTVTEHLLKLNNFNTALAIISGLNSSATYRLKYTRAELPKKTQLQFESVMQLMNSEGSYKAYRDALHNANPPCVPYLKRQLVAEVVTEIQLYQQFPYDLPKNDSLLSLFHHLPSSTEEQLYQISLLREPRNAERGDVA